MAEGYVYFDLFNQNLGSNPVRLISPTISAVEERSLCFTFWFAVFGAGESAQLRVVRQDNSSSDNGENPPLEKAKLKSSYHHECIITILIILNLPLFLSFFLVSFILTILRSEREREREMMMMDGGTNDTQGFQISDFCCIFFQLLRSTSMRLKSLSLEKAVTTKIHVNRMARRQEREA